MGERELNVWDALKRISSASATERKDGLADVEHIFKHNRNSLQLESLNDKAWHSIYDSLFQCVTIERSVYLKASHSQKARANTAVARLATCAKILRMTVTAGLRTIRVKTVKALFDHIMQALPAAEAGFCEGLSLDYVKCLRILSEYQPHVEHLLDTWHDVVNFCLEGISMLQDKSQNEDLVAPGSNGSSSLRTQHRSLSLSLSRRSRAGTPKLAGARVYPSSEFRAEVDDLVACVRYLTRATNAALQAKQRDILDGLIFFLNSSDAVRIAHHDAFVAINNVIARVSHSSISVTRNAMVQIYPVIKDFWTAKSSGLKHEMLVTLILTKNHVSTMVSLPSYSHFKKDLENLFDILQGEYAKRLERDQLQIGDLEMIWRSNADRQLLETSAFRLRRGNITAESHWTIVYLITFYSQLLDCDKRSVQDLNSWNGDGERTKRLRSSLLYQDSLRRASVGSTSSQVCALQMLAFLPHFSGFTDKQILEYIDHLTGIVAHPNSAISSWALMALACCAYQKASRSESLQASWLRLFQVVARTVATPTCSRSACHVMNVLLKLELVRYASIANILENMLSSIELHGPAVLADSSASLWTSMINLKASENPSASLIISERILRWTFNKWTPDKLSDKTYTAQVDANFRPADLIGLLDACNDRPAPDMKLLDFACHGSVAQAWLRAAQFEPLSRYLILADQDSHHLLQAPSESRLGNSGSRTIRSTFSAEILILEYCISETERVTANWSEWVSDSARNVLPDTICLVASLCIVNAAMVSRQTDHNQRRLEALRKLNEVLILDITNFLSQPGCGEENVCGVLGLIVDHLPSIGSASIEAEGSIMVFALHLSKALELRRNAKQSLPKSDNEDLMEVDDEFESQTNDHRAKDFRDNAARDDTTMTSDLSSFRACIAAYAYLLTCIFQARVESVSIDELAHIPSAFVHRMTSLTASEFLTCRSMLSNVSSGSLPYLAADVELLLEHIAANFLETFEFERHEVAQEIQLDILKECSSMWTDPDNGSLNELASSVYEWFITTGLPKNLCSLNVQIGIAELLFALLNSRGPDYKPHSSLPSVRTSLFELVSHGEIPVKYCISKQISRFFHHFTLGEHEIVFDDVRKNLPADEQSVEGMAIRLLFFSQLASAWQTLLRRCVYHIFETAGAVDLTVGHASYCMAKIAKSLALPSPQELFNLFASQLLFTWLQQWPVATIPFSIFGYGTLESLLEDSQDEIFAQLIMRSNDSEVADLSAKLSSSTTALLRRNFSKTAAYSLAWDIEIGRTLTHDQPQRSATKLHDQPQLSETRLNILEKKERTQLFQEHFATIVGVFFYAIDSGPLIDKALSKKEYTQIAAASLLEMRNASASSTILPADQQPLFKAKFFMDRIERLCRRAGVQAISLWSPQLYVYVLRILLSKIHPALGSLNACSIVRKIRVLVALSGSVPFSGYPLEMTLHALNPLITDKQCAEDALGVFQFLLTNGVIHLSRQISFVTGLLLSTLISLRNFVGSSQESTTQESQHRATISKASNFHKWLINTWNVEFAKHYGPQDSTFVAYLSLVNAASIAHNQANAMAESAESQVLQLILEDRRSGRRLLRGPVRDLVFGLLCSDFAAPPSYRNDILGHDAHATAFAAEVWSSCQHTKISKQYLLWAARVMGRAHNATGWTIRSLGSGATSHPVGDEIESKQLASKRVILQSLAESLCGAERKEVGVVEKTLRAILVSTKTAEELDEYQRLLPPAVASALTLTTTDAAVHLTVPNRPLEQCLSTDEIPSFGEWIRCLTISLVSSPGNDSLIGALRHVLHGVDSVAERLFAPILHLVLLEDFQRQQAIHELLSNACDNFFRVVKDSTVPHVTALINAILYLRQQPMPYEVTKADRTRWLNMDYAVAAEAAEKCGMHTTALLFAETSVAQATKTSRRSSIASIPRDLPDELLLSIFKNIDELDSYYGVQQNPGLAAVLDRLDYEADGLKGLVFRSARLDSQMRRHHETNTLDAEGLVRSLTSLNLNSVTHSLLSNQGQFSNGINMLDSVLDTARKLEQWDIRAPEIANTECSTTFKLFQGISNATDMGSVRRRLDSSFLDTIQSMRSPTQIRQPAKSSLRTLGMLTEVDDVMSAMSDENLRDAWKNMLNREERMLSAQVEDIRLVLSSRETLFSTLSKNEQLREQMHLDAKDARAVQVEALISSCVICRQRDALQESLATATYLSDLVPFCKSIGLNIEFEAQNEVADVLWDQGEHFTSIRMLQRLADPADWKGKRTGIERSKVLAKLGHHVAEARLEQPEEIMNRYLAPAITALHGLASGPIAGQVFHQFASFCDKQLQNAEAVEDFDRVQQMRERRKQELGLLDQNMKTTRSTTEKARIKSEYKKIEKWFRLENHEYQRLRNARESFMTQSLENYLHSLAASDTYGNDVLRFFSLWLEHAFSQSANASVSKHLDKVPSAKFARLMNQLSSRLQSEDTLFQNLLSNLILRVATDHPYHAMFHISAGTNVLGIKDESGKSRVTAAQKIAAALSIDKRVKSIWHNVHTSNNLYHQLAILKGKEGDRSTFKAGQEVRLDQFHASKTLAHRIKEFKVPPPTMTIALRADKDYTGIPTIQSFRPKMRIANGLSAPKILTAQCSDGRSFKQLFKGGHDDLRQDAIMEQVFEEVSKILRNHTATRQRNLLVRTYKVLPLSAQSGIMEFVQNTTALHDVLIPLHEAYFPKEFNTMQCRKKVQDVVGSSAEARIKAFKEVMGRFSPVMRFFFFENFVDPDEWFARRLAYTRSTAAISILGHIVGLGDRHLHNILLDQHSGEVVHIDLGVAFEAGRILPVAEVVPFRLTRDLVDAMGYTKTEGVFRRCCEFTLDALREERESIMTLLNVLRYDPLYSWSVSPLKAKRLQETEDERGGPSADDISEQSSKKKEDDVGEAARALTVVEKKLGKTLSTAATVSELIAQATDERNLALLFAGWSAWV